MIQLKYLSEDRGFCRIYYRSTNRLLYCRQEDFPGHYVWYRCSRDGEPSHVIDEDRIEIIK